MFATDRIEDRLHVVHALFEPEVLRAAVGHARAARSNELGEGVRRRGGGRKSAVVLQPGLLSALEELIEGAIRGDPQSPLRWVSRSQRNIATALRQQGFAVSQKLVGLLLRELDYSCQANRKTREGTQHPDRNAQFEYINARVKAALAAGQPAISVDTKKKELVGDFKNGGRELRRKGEPRAATRTSQNQRPAFPEALLPVGAGEVLAGHCSNSPQLLPACAVSASICSCSFLPSGRFGSGGGGA